MAAPDVLANVAANQMTFTAGAVVMLLNSAAGSDQHSIYMTAIANT